MIEILPVKDKEWEQKLLSAVEGAGKNTRAIAMTERGTLLGFAAVELQNGALLLRKLQVEGYAPGQSPDMEQLFCLDSLMRAAASYGEHAGADRIETTFPDFFDFLKSRGFETDERHAFTPMSTIVHYG